MDSAELSFRTRSTVDLGRGAETPDRWGCHVEQTRLQSGNEAEESDDGFGEAAERVLSKWNLSQPRPMVSRSLRKIIRPAISNQTTKAESALPTQSHRVAQDSLSLWAYSASRRGCSKRVSDAVTKDVAAISKAS